MSIHHQVNSKFYTSVCPSPEMSVQSNPVHTQRHTESNRAFSNKKHSALIQHVCVNEGQVTSELGDSLLDLMTHSQISRTELGSNTGNLLWVSKENSSFGWVVVV